MSITSYRSRNWSPFLSTWDRFRFLVSFVLLDLKFLRLMYIIVLFLLSIILSVLLQITTMYLQKCLINNTLQTANLSRAHEFTTGFSRVRIAQCLMLLYLILYIIYKIKVMFLKNWYPRETSLLYTGRQMWCSMSVRKCIRFCIPELHSWSEVKNTNMKFMKIQYKNTQISVYCIQHYCK
jgi:hypothetical protein